MKTSLAHLPENKQEELALIKKIILEYVKETAMIILFGSYARGDWIEDCYVEDGTTYTYISDFDILVVTKNAKAAKCNPKWDRVRDKIDGNPSITRTTLIAHSIQFLNAHLRDNYYFFVEIINQGILVYDSGNYTLEKPKSLSSKKRQQKAQDYFEDWFESANSFLKGFNFYLKEQAYKEAAFSLHQATERYYMTFLLVFTDYKPKIHDLKELDAQGSQINPMMRKELPQATEK
jgi:predicted nucleotidyltransferase